MKKNKIKFLKVRTNIIRPTIIIAIVEWNKDVKRSIKEIYQIVE